MYIGVDARVLYRPLRGIGKYLFDLIDHMVKLDSSLKFLFFYEELTGVKNIPQSPEISERGFIAKGYRFRAWEQLRLPWEMRKSGIDLFHAPANIVPLIQPCPIVATLHDTIMLESNFSDNGFYYKTILPLAFKKAKKIITISNNSKKDIIRLLKIPDERIEVIYHGVNKAFRKVDDMRHLQNTIKKFGIKGKYIYALGAADERKNTAMVIDVFAILKKERKLNYQLVISGIQECCIGKYAKKINDLGLENDVILIGYVTEEELVALYNQAKVFTYLSLYEGFGFPVLESMACGTPIVASNTSSIPELVDSAGLLVNPKDIYEITDALFSILNNENLQLKLKEKGFKRVQQFSWEKAAQQTLNAYEQVIKGAS